MSDNQYGDDRSPDTTGSAHPAERHADTEWVGTGDPPPRSPGQGPADGSGGRGRGRLLVAVAAAAAVVLVGAGGVVAFQALSGGGPQPADALPSSAIAYARVDLDPSADQKVNAVRLLRRVPQFEESTGITSDTDDLRRRLFEAALDTGTCTGVDYDADIEPWIGERAGAAAMPAGDGEDAQPVVALQVSDEDAARDGIEALLACGADAGADQPAGLAFVGEYALLAETQDLADEYAAAAEAQPLSEADGFNADMAALDGEGLMSFWVDVDAAVAIAQQSEPDLATTLEALGYDDLGSVSAALRARSDALELVYAGQASAIPGLQSDAPADDVLGLPETTLFAAGFTGGGAAVDQLWAQLGEFEGSLGDEGIPGGSLAALADQVQQQTGLVLPDDIATLLGDQFTLAVDAEGLSVDPSTGVPDPSTLNLAALMRTDPAAASDVVTRLQQLASASGVPLDLAQKEVDGGLVLAANDTYAGTIADGGGGLGDSDVFQAAVADGGDASSVLFLDLDRTATLVEGELGDLGAQVPPEVNETLDVFRAVGLSSVVDGDYNRTTLRLVFD